jgi:hydrogenase expression/formation protein HypD
LELLDKYFIKTTAYWRGIGDIANSGYTLRDKYARYAVNDMPIHNMPVHEAATAGCRCADVLLGRMNPNECGLFGKSCTPSHPVGACMVSAEGACGVWANGSLS